MPAKINSASFGWTSCVSTPRPTDGTIMPRYAVRNRLTSVCARRAGSAIRTIVVIAPLNRVPAPVPSAAPPIRNSTRLGEASHTESTTTIDPTNSAPEPISTSVRLVRPLNASCATAAAPNTRNAVNPASASEVWCNGPARNVGASEVNSAKVAKATKPAASAAKKGARRPCGACICWGRYEGRSWAGTTRVSGVSSRPSTATSIRPPYTR
jgi:hypothetical protein